MINQPTLFALNVHISLKAETLFTIGGVNVTNSMLLGFLTSVILVAIMLVVARKSSIQPKRGLRNIVEIITDFIMGVLEGSLGSREAAIKYTPYFGVYFFFIIFTNLSGLIPVIGPTITFLSNGEKVPLLRPFTADLNGTIALAIIAIILVQYFSIKEQGLKSHLSHYFFEKPLNPIYFFLGLIEIMGEFVRVISLSLRLFLNTAIGEIIIALLTSIIIAQGRTPLVVLPILALEIMVSCIQAYVFTILCATYLGLATSHHREKVAQQTIGLTATGHP